MTPSGRACPWWLQGAAAAAFLLYLLLAVFDTFFVPVEKDEGFYTYAFRLVAEGKVPYRDFSYIESPALPYYYATLLALPGITMRSVRVLSMFTGLAALLLLVRAARRAGGKTASAVAAILLFANPHLAEWFTRDVTYPLITLLLALAIRVELSSWPVAVRTGAQALLLALGGATKASMGLVALVWLGGLLWIRRQDRRAVLFGTGGFLAGLLVAVVPFVLADPSAFWFNIVSVPFSRGHLFPFMHKVDRLDQWLEFGAGQKILAARTVLLWNLPALALALLSLRRRSKGAPRGEGSLGPATLPVGAALTAGALFHLLVPSPAYPNYQFMLVPALTVLVALRFTRLEPVGNLAPARFGAAALVVILGALHWMGGVNPDEVGLEIGAWRHGPQRELTRLVAEIVPPDGRLLTDYLPVAVDADRRVVPGNEAGRSSMMPDLPEEQARAMHVLNRRSFVNVLRTGLAHGVVLTDQLTSQSFDSVPGFLEEVEAALSARYELVREFPAGVYFPYGRIRVFRLRTPSSAGASAQDDPLPGRSVHPDPPLHA
jgi:hypothetical protein